jgi:hypothetical protein
MVFIFSFCDLCVNIVFPPCHEYGFFLAGDVNRNVALMTNLQAASGSINTMTTFRAQFRHECSMWGVMTTINSPTPSLQKFLDMDPTFCAVVVGDKKTDDTKWNRY